LHGKTIGDLLIPSFKEAIKNASFVLNTKSDSSFLYLPPFLDNIGDDRLSDITTRIAYKPLQKFTISVMRQYGYVDIRRTKSSFWDADSSCWKVEELLLPYYDDKPFLLTPKILVSNKVNWSSFSWAIEGGLVYYIQQHFDESEFESSRVNNKPERISLKFIKTQILVKYRSLDEFCKRNLDIYESHAKYKCVNILDLYYVKYEKRNKKREDFKSNQRSK